MKRVKKEVCRHCGVEVYWGKASGMWRHGMGQSPSDWARCVENGCEGSKGHAKPAEGSVVIFDENKCNKSECF